jgi:inner membrane protein
VRLDPQVLTRGIYEVPVYEASIGMNAEFVLPWETELPVDRLVRVHWDEARIAVGIQGVSGLRAQPAVAVDGRAVTIASSNRQIGVARSGIAVAVNEAAPGSVHTADVALTLGGGGSIHFVPAAVRSALTMTSAWPSPSFGGEMLPSGRELTDDGFEAHWETTSLGMGMPDVWLASGSGGSGGSSEHWLEWNRIGVELFRPVGHYQQTTRSVKYGILFVLLPMVALFLLEVFTSVRIHPIQYLMVAAAKTVFYLLLLSLSEQIGFTTAYWGAAAVTSILVTGYIAGLVERRIHAFLVGGVVATEYLFLFTALGSEDYALLVGSLGLFALLAVVMIATRKINWYAAGRS